MSDFRDLLATDDDIIEAVKHVVCIGGGNQLCSRGQSVITPVRPHIRLLDREKHPSDQISLQQI